MYFISFLVLLYVYCVSKFIVHLFFYTLHSCWNLLLMDSLLSRYTCYPQVQPIFPTLFAWRRDKISLACARIYRKPEQIPSVTWYYQFVVNESICRICIAPSVFYDTILYIFFYFLNFMRMINCKCISYFNATKRFQRNISRSREFKEIRLFI